MSDILLLVLVVTNLIMLATQLAMFSLVVNFMRGLADELREQR